ncbi:hypothetical protein predicted by Glimmer/Critica [Stenotrophomonas maltophilia RA8]|jgi:hypothetical protein|nr:hypothetical protein DF40_009140 [Stenotrophomonas maltophilia M30]MBA0233247.1 hypothetical protein [Stenotrophomonas maltophilia]MBA0267286.1 hypothetical protein [Stenotrophomonas maltophilia]MBA0455230.1 hypothetical protein [Stenotrophomonas maltophilia]CCP15455.1 hypothetical protein predicted by Glimmer/Critica [Stenotrophomonas maltophilia RA8]
MYLTKDLSKVKARHIQMEWLSAFLFHSQSSDGRPFFDIRETYDLRLNDEPRELTNDPDGVFASASNHYENAYTLALGGHYEAISKLANPASDAGNTVAALVLLRLIARFNYALAVVGSREVQDLAFYANMKDPTYMQLRVDSHVVNLYHTLEDGSGEHVIPFLAFSMNPSSIFESYVLRGEITQENIEFVMSEAGVDATLTRLKDVVGTIINTINDAHRKVWDEFFGLYDEKYGKSLFYETLSHQIGFKRSLLEVCYKS